MKSSRQKLVSGEKLDFRVIVKVNKNSRFVVGSFSGS